MSSFIYIHPAKLGPIKRGHPWIFPKAISRQSNRLRTSELVQIYENDGQLLGLGVYNEHSLYKVRVLALAHENIDLSSLQSIIDHRLKQAISLRQAIQLPNFNTSAYRLFNSEGDGLSGLTIDRFNQICVVSSSAFWVESNKQLIIEILQRLLPSDEILWHPQFKALTQDGWENFIETKVDRVECIKENGINFEVHFANAQKTGLFLDQRENHYRIASLSKNKRVLDLYSYTGGFALNAAKNGAIKVTAVDSSAQAISHAKRNAAINDLNQIDWIENDAREFLSEAGNYDLIILDPPKLIPSQKFLFRAKNYYRFLHREIFKVMTRGSLLLSCNCSSAISSSDFVELVYAQAQTMGKTTRVLGVYGPASCHPTIPVFPEGNYLTATLLSIV